MTRLALLCPGQGGQHPAMFDVPARDPAAAAALQRWDLDDLLGAAPADLLADPALLFANRHAQPLVVAATLASWEGLRARLPEPVLVAGYSIGELAAASVAGALPAADAIELAVLRAQLMDECADATPVQAMLAVAGLPVDGDAMAALPAHVAIVNGADSAILGCLQVDLPLLEQRIAAAGGRTTRLPVAVASHTPWMQAAAGRFAALLQHAAVRDPAVPLLAGISAARVLRRDDFAAGLAGQIAHTIRWADCMDALAEAGVDVVLELGPGSALARMLAARHPQLPCRSVADFRSLEAAARWVERAA